MFKLSDVYQQITVEVAFEIEDISAFSDSDKSYRLDYTIHMSWVTAAANCLTHTKKLCIQDMDFSSRPIKLRSPLFPLVWLPDLYIMNSRSDGPRTHAVDQRYVQIKRVPVTTCGLHYTIKSSAIMTCPMNFAKYPSDVQNCPVRIRSCELIKILFYES